MPRYCIVVKEEIERLNELFADVDSFADAEKAFGPPDNDYGPEIKAGWHFTVDRTLEAEAVIAYTRFSDSADVRLLPVPDGRFFKLVWPKLMGRA